MVRLMLMLRLTLNAIFGHSKKTIRLLLAMGAEPSPGTGTYPAHVRVTVPTGTGVSGVALFLSIETQEKWLTSKVY